MRYKKLTELYDRLNFITFLKVVLLEAVEKILFPGAKYFFSQAGEDVKILYLLQKYNSGFYIDIGSNDPILNSNTFKLYLMGWNGLLVDGNSQLINKAKKIRKKDICINTLVSNRVEKVKFYIAENHQMSSMDKQFSELVSPSNYTPVEIEMETVTLNDLVEKYVPKGKHIDVLSIDVEGHDFEVLKSIDLNTHTPNLIVIENLNHWKSPIDENLVNSHLVLHNYSLVSKDQFNLYYLYNTILEVKHVAEV
jgi:FkbM family methyltransferase